MPIRPTKGTTAVYLDLPTELVLRVRDFAKRDQRTVKTEYIRALELLLATYDKQPAGPLGQVPAAAPSTPPAEAERPHSQKALGGAQQSSGEGKAKQPHSRPRKRS